MSSQKYALNVKSPECVQKLLIDNKLVAGNIQPNFQNQFHLMTEIKWKNIYERLPNKQIQV